DINGGPGNDRLFGGANNDVVEGGPGDDVLDGGSNNDFLIGVEGADSFAGDGGFDTYKLEFDPTHWVSSFDRTDVNQEKSPICTIGAALSSAAAHADVSRNIRYLGNNKYSVRLFQDRKSVKETVYFNGEWTDADFAPTQIRQDGVLTGINDGEFW